MDQRLAEILVQVCEDDGLDVSLRESYAGRGMYSKDTVGVVLHDGDVTDILQAVINNATCFIVEEGSVDFDLNPEFDLSEMFTCNGFKLDSMGKGMILY